LIGSGVVRWARKEEKDDSPLGCGIEFKNLDAEGAARVAELIKAFKMKSFIPRK